MPLRHHRNRRTAPNPIKNRVVLIAFATIFVIVPLSIRQDLDPVKKWTILIVCGGIALIMLLQLLDPRKLFVEYYALRARRKAEEEYQQKIKEFGSFSYTETGFIVHFTSQAEEEYEWTDITTIFGFKLDLMTIDEVSLDVFTTDGKSYRKYESDADWDKLLLQLYDVFPTMDKDWEMKVAFPAFATNMILLYDKKGRTPQQAEDACYDQPTNPV